MKALPEPVRVPTAALPLGIPSTVHRMLVLPLPRTVAVMLTVPPASTVAEAGFSVSVTGGTSPTVRVTLAVALPPELVALTV